MSNRAEIQEAHEMAVLTAALEEHNHNLGTGFEVVDRPDPPDAILSDGSLTTWLEITDAFYSFEWARDVSSYAADELHRPMQRGLHMNMDAQLAKRACDLILRKAAKESYKPFIKDLGPGILVVGLESPWLDGDETFTAIEAEWENRNTPDVSSTFAYIYFGFRDNNGNRAVLWRSS